MDPRYESFAQLLTGYSLELKRGEVVVIEIYDDVDLEMIIALIREVRRAGAVPVLLYKKMAFIRALLEDIGPEARELQLIAHSERTLMMAADCYIGMRGMVNPAELAGVKPENLQLYNLLWVGPVHHEERIPHTRWVVTRFPTATYAHMAGMSANDFKDCFFKTVLVDYGKMKQAMLPLKTLMEKTDKVRIEGPGTDLSFSIKGIPACICAGNINVPDGELFTSVVLGSTEGKITFNLPAFRDGQRFEMVRFIFKNGKAVSSSCQSGDKERLKAILDTDKGSRVPGEFSIAVNPEVKEVMGESIWDEKIRGTIHMAIGGCLPQTPNGNQSSIHWDLICDQRKEHGGGEIYFDGVLVRKDGLFVLEELAGLNPDQLTKA